jgi:hypothetical protein
VKGQLEGQAKFLSGFLGKAELGGQIESARKSIYQDSEGFFAAQKEAYLAYIFCILITQDRSLPTSEKLKALEEFKRPLERSRSQDSSAEKNSRQSEPASSYTQVGPLRVSAALAQGVVDYAYVHRFRIFVSMKIENAGRYEVGLARRDFYRASFVGIGGNCQVERIAGLNEVSEGMRFTYEHETKLDPGSHIVLNYVFDCSGVLTGGVGAITDQLWMVEAGRARSVTISLSNVRVVAAR